MADRLLVDLDADGQVAVGITPEGGLPETVSRAPLAWPLEQAAQEDLRWYLEDYLRAPYGVWEERGPKIQAKLARWGEAVFASVFGSGPARDAYQRARDRGLELVFRSPDPGLLGLPWELMRDGAGPVALNLGGVSRALPVADLTHTAEVPGGRLRVLMVISRPEGTGDVGYQMIARPLLHRLDAVRGQVNLVVLRPPTLDALREALAEAASSGQPFQVVHFDGHGALPGRPVGGGGLGGRPVMMTGPAAEGVLAFEKPGGGSDPVTASKLAAVLKAAGVPVVVLNACQSGAVGKDLEAAVATRLLREGCAAVVAMAYNVYAVAAAEFMAVFYERLFAGDTLTAAVTAGRRQLFQRDERPSPKGKLPLADWLVPVHYLRREVSFTQARITRPAQAPSLEALLDDFRAPAQEQAGGTDLLDPVGMFVGRDDLFYELDAAARLQKVVVLHGPGGTGKTEVAKAFGRWWRDTGGTDRPEWVLWHSFEPGVASFGLDGVITQTGLAVFGPDFARLAEAERQQVVERLLAQQRLLLIWDNFETVRTMPDPTGATAPLDDSECVKVKDFLARLAAKGKSAVIITSRTIEDWLGPVRRIGVGGLARDEAAEYANNLLAPYRAAVERRNRRAFGEMLEWLGGHPLSMRLILPRLNTAEPEALLDGLRGTTPLPGGDDGGDRTTSLAASITYSFTHLTGTTRRLLPAVSLFYGVTDSDVLAFFSQGPDVPSRFAAVSREEWKLALGDAARVGLLTPLAGGMYRIHPALPAFLAARWRAEDADNHDSMLEAATRTLAAAYAAFGSWLNDQIGSGDAGIAYALVGLQRQTFGALLGYTLDQRTWEQALNIIRPLNAYWDVRGLDVEAREWVNRIHIATEGPDGEPPRLDSPAGSLWRFVTSAQAIRQQRTMHLDDAEHTYRQILDAFQIQPASRDQQFYIADASHELGNIAVLRGRLEEAENWYRQSLAIFENLSLRNGMANSYHALGIVAYDRGRLEEAENWHRKSAVIFEELGDQPRLASSYHELGLVASQRRQLTAAENWHRKSLAIKQNLGNRLGMANSFLHLGGIAQAQGLLAEAEDLYRQSLPIFEALGDQVHIAGSYHELGNMAFRRGQLKDAEDWYRKSLAIFEGVGDRRRAAGALYQLGRVAQAGGQLEGAEEWYRRSLAIFLDLADPHGMALNYGQLGELAEKREQPMEALDWTVRSVAQFEEFPHPLATHTPRLARLTTQLGIPALEASWLKIAGNPLPQAVHDYIISSGVPAD